MKLSEISDYMLLISNDFKMLHLNCVGNNFMVIHSWLEDLYNESSDYYDSLAEMAIEHDEIIENPSLALNRVQDFIPFTELENLSESLILDKMYELLECAICQLNCIDDNYENYVYSNLDEMLSSFKKNLYKLKQTLK